MTISLPIQVRAVHPTPAVDAMLAVLQKWMFAYPVHTMQNRALANALLEMQRVGMIEVEWRSTTEEERRAWLEKNLHTRGQAHEST